MRILQISTRPYEFWSTMCNEGELLEKFNIQLTPIPMPELTDEMKKAKAEGTEGCKGCRILPPEHGNLCKRQRA